VTADGGVLSHEAVGEELELTNDSCDKQWYIVGAEINEENQDLVCDHTGKKIPCGCGDEAED
jgi:hypothetical protein